MNKELSLASYHALIVLACIDQEVVFPEMKVVNRFIADPLFDIDFDPEEHFDLVCETTKAHRQEIFEKSTLFISRNSSAAFKERVYQYAKELVSADDVVKQAEFDLMIKMAERFNLLEEGLEFDVPIEWNKETLKAMEFCKHLNELESDYEEGEEIGQDQIAGVKYQFQTDRGPVYHEVSYDGSKTNYQSASAALKQHMIHVRALAQSKASDILYNDFNNLRNQDNSRFTFKHNNQMFFAMMNLANDRPRLTYVGCKEWDFHL